jgi:hypothetical protein
MKLKSFQVLNFQSVIDSGEIGVDDVACLVGKNEAGKSALLKALYRMNPVRKGDGNFSVTDDYPRSEVTAYEAKLKKLPGQHGAVVKATYYLEPEDVALITTVFGEKFLKKPEVCLTKTYGNSRSFNMDVDNSEAVKHLTANIPKDAQKKVKGNEQPSELVTLLAASSGQPAVDSLIAFLKKLGDKPFEHYVWNTLLMEHEPRYLYFDEYYQMLGCENIEALLQRKSADQLKPSDEPLLGLVELAGIDLQEMLNAQRTQDIKNKLEGTGVHLTKQILPYWSQNRHLQLKFDVRVAKPSDPEGMTQGHNLWGEVYDTKQYASTALGSRSKGFVWFFSFIAWYSQVKESGNKTILLLDEPGLTLHGRAQGDLLRYFEKELKDNNQLIYSTHSPFMVDPDRFDRVRIVQNLSVEHDDPPKGKEGTRYVPDVLDATDDSLFPLQGALGYDIHQTLFVGPNCLLVEGPGDLLFLQAIASELGRRKREGLSEKWTVTPVGGSSKIPTFVRLLNNQKGMKVATLIDIQKSDEKMIESLYKGNLLKKAHVHTFADFTGTKEADIEDMFDASFYLDLVNAEYGKALQAPLEEKDFKSKAPRIVVRIEQHLKDQPMKVGEFGHFRPARYMAENLATVAPRLSDDSLKRFEAVFTKLNKLL